MASASYIRGDREVTAALRQLGKGPPARDIDAAAKLAMQPMLDETKKAMVINRNYVGKWPAWFTQPKSPRPGGYVDTGVGIRPGRMSTTTRTYKMGATSRRARFLLHLLEFGTSPHWEPNFHGGWMHPGAVPYPAMVPAFEANKMSVIRTFGIEIIARIERQATSIGLRTRRK